MGFFDLFKKKTVNNSSTEIASSTTEIVPPILIVPHLTIIPNEEETSEKVESNVGTITRTFRVTKRMNMYTKKSHFVIQDEDDSYISYNGETRNYCTEYCRFSERGTVDTAIKNYLERFYDCEKFLVEVEKETVKFNINTR